VDVQPTVTEEADRNAEKKEAPPRETGPKEWTWKSIPRILRFRNPFAVSEGNSRGQEERLLREEGLKKEEVAALREFINELDRKLDQEFGVLPFYAQHGMGDDKGGPAAQMKRLMSAALGEMTIEGVDPEALRIRALCRMACFDRDESAIPFLNSLATSGSDPDVKVAAALALAIWKESTTVATWMAANQGSEEVAALVEGLQYPVVGSTPLGGGARRERLMPRFSAELAASLVEARQKATDPILRRRLLDLLGHCAYGGHSAAAAEELMVEFRSPATHQSQTVALRGLLNCLELESTRSRLMELASGADARLAGLSIHALGTNLHEDSVARLGQLIETSDVDRTKAIIRALKEGRGKLAVSALTILEKAAAVHVDESVRKLAQDAAAEVQKNIASDAKGP
jgi:hypothetical protein